MTKYEKEERELKMLRVLQADSTRWLSQEEFDRIKELSTTKNSNKPLKQ